ncbi:hypothetical protein NL676_010077 [Syzygium grande]|nr:hypothetical protein NL676_010077 [Syzygium grande]
MKNAAVGRQTAAASPRNCASRSCPGRKVCTLQPRKRWLFRFVPGIEPDFLSRTKFKKYRSNRPHLGGGGAHPLPPPATPLLRRAFTRPGPAPRGRADAGTRRPACPPPRHQHSRRGGGNGSERDFFVRAKYLAASSTVAYSRDPTLRFPISLHLARLEQVGDCWSRCFSTSSAASLSIRLPRHGGCAGEESSIAAARTSIDRKEEQSVRIVAAATATARGSAAWDAQRNDLVRELSTAPEVRALSEFRTVPPPAYRRTGRGRRNPSPAASTFNRALTLCHAASLKILLHQELLACC